MDGLEDRVRVLEKQVRRSYVLLVVIALALVVWVALGILGVAPWTTMHTTLARFSPEMILRVGRLEIGESITSRPVCVLRADGGGGRIEVFDPNGNPTAGLDGNQGLVVRLAEGLQFPETRPPR